MARWKRRGRRNACICPLSAGHSGFTRRMCAGLHIHQPIVGPYKSTPATLPARCSRSLRSSPLAGEAAWMVSGQRRTARPQSVSVAGWLRHKISAAHGHPEPADMRPDNGASGRAAAINNRRSVRSRSGRLVALRDDRWSQSPREIRRYGRGSGSVNRSSMLHRIGIMLEGISWPKCESSCTVASPC